MPHLLPDLLFPTLITARVFRPSDASGWMVTTRGPLAFGTLKLRARDGGAALAEAFTLIDSYLALAEPLASDPKGG